MSCTPWDRCAASSPSVNTWCPRLPSTAQQKCLRYKEVMGKRYAMVPISMDIRTLSFRLSCNTHSLCPSRNRAYESYMKNSEHSLATHPWWWQCRCPGSQARPSRQLYWHFLRVLTPRTCGQRVKWFEISFRTHRLYHSQFRHRSFSDASASSRIFESCPRWEDLSLWAISRMLVEASKRRPSASTCRWHPQQRQLCNIDIGCARCVYLFL